MIEENRSFKAWKMSGDEKKFTDAKHRSKRKTYRYMGKKWKQDALVDKPNSADVRDEIIR